MTHSIKPLAAAAAAAFAATLATVPAAAVDLPDIAPEVFGTSVQITNVPAGDVAEGCAGGTTGRRLIRYGLRNRNLGPGDLVLGDPGCPDCSSHPGAQCTNPLFICSPAHGHVHFESFARAELLDAMGDVVAEGQKDGFCILDSECAVLHYSCNFQGLTAGCADVYAPGTPCQYVDITDLPLPAGTYTLRVTVDPEDQIAEADETNNVTTTTVELGGPPGTPTPTITPVPLCLAAPRSGCRESGASRLRLTNPAGDGHDRVMWSWIKGTTSKASFGNPLAVTRYAFCIYDESAGEPLLASSAQVAAQGVCGRHPCWRARGSQSFTYFDSRGTSDGVTRISLKRGAHGDAKIVLRGKGDALTLPSLPFAPYAAVRAQLVNSDGECWEAVYTAPAPRNTVAEFKDSTP